MIKICIRENYFYRGKEFSNSLINLNSITEIYKDYISYSLNGEDFKLYKIIFLTLNDNEIIWNFNEEKDRDLQYYELVSK